MTQEELNQGLINAINEGHAATTEGFILLGADPNTVGQSNMSGVFMTALNLAAEANYTRCIKALLEAGADPNIPDEQERIPLYFAASYENTDAVQLLIEAGSDILKYTNLNKCISHSSPLHMASSHKNSDAACLKLMLEAGVDPNVTYRDGLSPLHTASHSGSVRCIEALLAAGADVNCRNINGDTPLHYASYCSNIAIMKLLIKAGADISIKNCWGHDPLQSLAKSCPGRHSRSVPGLLKFAEKERAKRLRAEDARSPTDTGFEFDI